MTSVQPPYRVVIAREHRSRPTNRTLHDEVIWIGSLEPVPTKKELHRVGDADDSRPYRVDNIRF
jgi:hypothetical protein